MSENATRSILIGADAEAMLDPLAPAGLLHAAEEHPADRHRLERRHLEDQRGAIGGGRRERGEHRIAEVGSRAGVGRGDRDLATRATDLLFRPHLPGKLVGLVASVDALRLAVLHQVRGEREQEHGEAEPQTFLSSRGQKSLRSMPQMPTVSAARPKIAAPAS